MIAPFQSYCKKAHAFNALVLKAKKNSERLTSGSQQSFFKGRGITFQEVRKYQAGDDVRSIHWSITARLREPHIKLYKEDRDLSLWFLIDVSGSGIFGTHKQTKFEAITELCAVIALTAQKSNCSIGAVFYSDRLEKVVLPQKGNLHCLKIFHSLTNQNITGSKTSIASALDYLMKIASKGSLIVVLSDFMSNAYDRSLKVISQKHDLLGIRIYDKSEVNFPSASFMHIIDSETGETATVNTSSKQFQLSYTTWYHEKVAYFEKAFTQAGAGILNVATDEEYSDKLVSYFQKR
ncbi:DUF58 domain-containing protein [Pontibacter saemangeumensis]|uniref:DUF58 domain-containing protein n=1 Tax=Pontibacter saemangeumensis TaxID=1084525 RepID=A0ABP8LXL6_9BACT